jgi:hypothetical protein
MSPVPESKRVLPPEVLGLPVRGPRVEGGSLGLLIAGEATVLAFLRHFG